MYNKTTSISQEALDFDVVTEELTGCVLKKRFLIGNEIDRGSFGSVFKIVDLQNK